MFQPSQLVLINMRGEFFVYLGMIVVQKILLLIRQQDNIDCIKIEGNQGQFFEAEESSGIIISIVISMLAGLLPANRASKLDPVESLRKE